MSEKDFDEAEKEINAIVAAARLVFVGHDPHVQGAALGELFAIWLAGHPNFLRETALSQTVKLARDLIEPCEREVFHGGTHPQNR
jgi:hypothetical protein